MSGKKPWGQEFWYVAAARSDGRQPSLEKAIAEDTDHPTIFLTEEDATKYRDEARRGLPFPDAKSIQVFSATAVFPEIDL